MAKVSMGKCVNFSRSGGLSVVGVEIIVEGESEPTQYFDPEHRCIIQQQPLGSNDYFHRELGVFFTIDNSRPSTLS